MFIYLIKPRFGPCQNQFNFSIVFFTTTDCPAQQNTIQFSLNHARKLFPIKFTKDSTFKEQDNLVGLLWCIKYHSLYSKVSAAELLINILGEITVTY